VFDKKDFVSHSGEKLTWKIEVDDLDHYDIETLAYLISQRKKFTKVFGVPTGGNRLAFELAQYEDLMPNTILLVDDVMTTGGSMESMKVELQNQYPTFDIEGVVIFCRDIEKCPSWVEPIFILSEGFSKI
jgi:orotate phosphoribosyltransferase